MALYPEDVFGMQIPLVEANSSVYPPRGEYDPITQQEDVISSGLFTDPSIQQPFSFQPMMANQPSSIVGGMFSPELSRAAQMEYMQKRQGDMQARAMAFAQLSPMQQADYGFYRGGQQLGDALGGALGGTDPQLQKIGLQQQILSELDPSNPEQNLMIAQKYARVAPELAMRIANEARTALVRVKQAQGANRQGVTAKIQVAERIALDEGLAAGTQPYKTRVAQLLQGSENLSEAERKGARVAEITRLLNVGDGGIPFSQKERAALEAELATYERPDKQLSLTNDRDAISAELYDNKPFAQITPAQKAVVNKRVEAEQRAKAEATGSGIKKYQDIPKLRADIFTTVKPFKDTVNATDTALASLKLSIDQDNPIAFNASRRLLAKALDGGQISNKDVQDAGGDPSILGSLVDVTSTAFTSTPSLDTQNKLKATLNAIRKVALQKGRSEIETQRTLAKRSNFTDEDFDLASDIPEFKKTPTKKIEPFDADKEKRYQEFKAKQSGVTR